MISQYLAKTNSDKISHHGYGDFYDRVFDSLTVGGAMSIRMLEIGVSRFGKGSAHAFCACPRVKLYVGIDTKRLEVPLPEGNMFLQMDAYRYEAVARAMAYAPFNLIIDDGSHLPWDQIYFFEQYYDLCHNEGVMVCEDVHQRYLDEGAYRPLKRLENHLDISLVRPSFFGGEDDSNLLVLWK